MSKEKALVIGDTHLQFKSILPLLKDCITKYKPNRLIFVGDYTDQWGAQNNTDLYREEMSLLYTFKSEMATQNIEVTYLIGNHDAAYLTGHIQHYSTPHLKTQSFIRRALKFMNAQIATTSNGYMISHAGFAGNRLKPEYTKTSPIRVLSALEHKQPTIPTSCLWLRPEELAENPSIHYPKQIFGHTPTQTINPNVNNINIDTFSLTSDFKQIGDGSILLLENNKASVIYLPWCSPFSKD